jgi:hypothetical protein
MSSKAEELIEQAFTDVPAPDEDSLAASVGEEALEETDPFRGKQWQDLDPDFVEAHLNGLFWFSPEAFHYYLPAFLRAGLAKPKSDLALEVMLYLRPEKDPELAAFSRERWSLLNDEQIRAMEAWLRAVFPADNGALPDALKVIDRRYWWK